MHEIVEEARKGRFVLCWIEISHHLRQSAEPGEFIYVPEGHGSHFTSSFALVARAIYFPAALQWGDGGGAQRRRRVKLRPHMSR